MFKILIIIGWVCAGGLAVCTTIYFVRNFSSSQKAEQFAAEVKRREKLRKVPVPQHYTNRIVETAVKQLPAKPKSHVRKPPSSQDRDKRTDFSLKEMKRIQGEVATLVGTSEGDNLVPGCKLTMVDGKPYFNFPEAAKIKVGRWTLGERPALIGQGLGSVIWSGHSKTNIITGCRRAIDGRFLKDEPIYHCMDVASGVLTSTEQLYYLNLYGKILNADEQDMLSLMDETEDSFVANYDSVSIVTERSVRADGASEKVLINGCVESEIRWYLIGSAKYFSVTFMYSPAGGLASEESKAIAEALTDAGFTF